MGLSETDQTDHHRTDKTTFESFLDHVLTTCGTPENMDLITDRLLRTVSLRFQYVHIMFHTLSVMVIIQTCLLILVVFMLYRSGYSI
jgi:hypothetical protein